MLLAELTGLEADRPARIARQRFGKNRGCRDIGRENQGMEPPEADNKLSACNLLLHAAGIPPVDFPGQLLRWGQVFEKPLVFWAKRQQNDPGKAIAKDANQPLQ